MIRRILIYLSAKILRKPEANVEQKLWYNVFLRKKRAASIRAGK